MDLETGCYVIAEIGVNHNGSVELARELIDVAAEAGADAVKFQTFSADDLVTRDAPKAEYQVERTGDDRTQHAMLAELELTEDEFGLLRSHCERREIDFLSTPFGERAADMLERVGVGAFKVSSGDLTHHRLLAHLARKGRPIILSTGMANLAEVDDAMRAISNARDVPVALLHCVSAYPAAPASCNLAAMATLSRAFGRPVGWSDHTVGVAIGFASVAMGARLLEKHITLDSAMPGPDHAASMEPTDFRDFVRGIRDIGTAVGDGIKRPQPEEAATASVARRSIVATRHLAEGAVVTADDVAIMRPASGLEPALIDLVVGCRLGRDVEAHAPIRIEDLHG